MHRITISVDDALAESFDAMIGQRAYASRSEALRDVLRGAVEAWREEEGATVQCVASLSYVYDRRVRLLAQRLSGLQHDHHDLVLSATVVRMDHYFSMECVMLRGPTPAVRRFADAVRAQRGVRFGSINLVGVEPHDHHDRPDQHVHRGHDHRSPIGS